MFILCLFLIAINELDAHEENTTAQSMAPTNEQININPPSQISPPTRPSCTVAIFDVIELKMNRTKTVRVLVGTSIRYNTLVLQPQSCTVQYYAGDHQNTTIYMTIGILPYRVMVESPFANKIPPSPVFQGLMSTISPTFANPNYAIIPTDCKTVQCPVN